MFKRILAALAVSLLLASCGTIRPSGDLGSFDPAKAELLADGRARYVDILAFNDFHATVYEDPLGKNVGMAKMASVIARLRELNPNTVVVSGGDNFQGSALSIVSHGSIVSEFFKTIGVAASAVGNHEFDWTDAYFEQWSRDGGYPFLAANIIDVRTGETPAWAQPYAIVRVGGRTVAFIGLSTVDTPSATKAAYVENYRFTDAADAARTWSNYLRVTFKPDAIIALTHIPSAMDGLDRGQAIPASAAGELEALAERGGVDAIITGHSHNAVLGSSHGVPVVQASYNGRSFGRIRLTFKEGGGVSLSASLVEFWQEKAELAADPAAQAIIDRYVAEYGTLFLQRVARVEGELAHDRLLTPNVSPMGAWVSSVLRERYGVDVAIMNGGGLRKPFAAGWVAVQDFWDLMPFDNTAVLFEATGADLRAMIDHGIDSLDFANGQFAGLVVRYNPSRLYGSKIVSMTLADGTPVEDGKLYRIMTNDFIFEGGDAYSMMLPAARNVTYTWEPIRDALIEEARKAGVIVAETPDWLVPVSD